MSTEQRNLSQATASNSGEDDIGALIYRESQLRKREVTAAAAARTRKKSSASTHRSTSTRRGDSAAASIRAIVR